MQAMRKIGLDYTTAKIEKLFTCKANLAICRSVGKHSNLGGHRGQTGLFSMAKI